jgi:hypothetical protein
MKLSAYIKKIHRILANLSDFPDRFEDLQQAVARVEARQLITLNSTNLQDYEFKAYSQNGEDGIIQFLINQVEIANPTFVEFGVHDYMESNTRFLLKQNNWSGLVIDGSQKNIDFIKSDPLYWRHNLKAECAFINRDNINHLISSNGLSGDLGILSVDIDGNDYWVWEAINCVNPRIVICEYNGLFGPSAKVSVPYDENFIYDQAHYSTLYWGASIAAFHHLARRKGYSLVGSNTNGNNIFFVRDDLLGNLPSLTPEQAYIKSTFRTSRDPQGNLTFLDLQDGFPLVADLPLVDVSTVKTVTLREVNQRPLALV